MVITDATGSYVAPSSGGSQVVTFGIGIYVNGSKVTGTFPAISVTITSPAISVGSSVSMVTGSGLQPAGAAVRDGSASFSITSDPVVEVTAPVGAATSGSTGGTSSGTAIAGATSGETGKPFLLEEMVAVALLAFGALVLVALRLRRRPA